MLAVVLCVCSIGLPAHGGGPDATPNSNPNPDKISQTLWNALTAEGESSTTSQVRVLVWVDLTASSSTPDSDAIDRSAAVDRPNPRPPRMPDRVLRDLRERLNSRPALQATPLQSMIQLPVLTGPLDSAAVAHLAADEAVLALDLDQRMTTQMDVVLPLLGMDQLHDLAMPVGGVQGQGVKVAVIDSGVDLTHPALVGSVADDGEAEACFAVDGCPDGSAEQFGPGAAAATDGHGTAVSAALLSRGGAGVAVGPAPEAQMVAVRVAAANGDIYLSDVIAAIEWLADEHTDLAVVNISLGAEASFTGTSCDQLDTASVSPSQTWLAVLEQAVDLLVAEDILVVASAGNAGHDDKVAAPACLSNVISVGATWKQDYAGAVTVGACTDSAPKQDQRACFSNVSEDLELMAPGALIKTAGFTGTTPTALSQAGTSFSSPIVAGCVAQLRGALPDLSAEDVRAALLQTDVMVEVEVAGQDPFEFPRLNCQMAFDHLDRLFQDRFQQ